VDGPAAAVDVVNLERVFPSISERAAQSALAAQGGDQLGAAAWSVGVGLLSTSSPTPAPASSKSTGE
jgi:hypothetical protein